MLDFCIGKRKFSVFVFWLSKNHNRIATEKFLQQKFTIKPNRFRVIPIRIRQNRFDKRFLVSCDFARDEFNLAFYRLFFGDIDTGKAC